MTSSEFNLKYKDFLEEGHYGLEINIPRVTEYLDKIFNDLTKIPGFKFSQIKLKFDQARFYTNIWEVFPEFRFELEKIIEREINRLVSIEDGIQEYIKNNK